MSRDSVEPIHRVLWLAVGAVAVIGAAVMSLLPESPIQVAKPGDKLLHAAGYWFLMLWFSQVYVATAPRIGAASVLLLLSGVLEILQLLGPGDRSLSFGDMAANCAGIALGWLCAPPRVPNFLAALERADSARGVKR